MLLLQLLSILISRNAYLKYNTLDKGGLKLFEQLGLAVSVNLSLGIEGKFWGKVKNVERILEAKLK